jgi:signal transduction histidine kinase
MSLYGQPSPPDAPTPSDPAPADELSVRQLAHELNSLIDGAMRSMRLAERALAVQTDSAHNADARLDEAIQRLRTAETGLEDMASLLARVLDHASHGTGLLASDRDLADECARVVDRLQPLAERLGVQMTVRMADDVARVPARTLGPVISNGLHNAILACSVDGLAARSVELSASRSEDRNSLVLLIADTGPGPAAFDEHGGRPGGHGLGLTLCRQIVKQLGGSLELMPVPFGAGAVLHVRVPLERLEP